jgi:glycosyltransferase involved in cell wall biosynthesis
MHVSLLVPAPFDAVSGGYEYDRRMVAGLRAAGHVVRVYELAGTHPLPDDAATDAALVAFDAQPRDSLIVIDGLALPAFTDLLAESGARPCVGLIHHPTSLEAGLSDAIRDSLAAIERVLFPRLVRIITTSTTTADTLVAQFGVDRGVIAVVEPGTDPAPRSLGSGGPACRILSVGTLVPRKGHDVLLRALAMLPDLDWHLTIAGSAERAPEHAAELASLASELGIAERVVFAGEVTGEALDVLWREADIFALATWFEGYGMAVAEALRRGLPVAVCAGGAAARLVTSESGVIVQPGDHVQLGKALRRMVFDSVLRATMAEAAFAVGATLSGWDAQIIAFEDALT